MAVRLTLFPVTATPPSSLCSFNPLSRSSSLSGKILSPNSNLPVSLGRYLCWLLLSQLLLELQLHHIVTFQLQYLLR